MKMCNGNYESAMHYDCQICGAECPYRKNEYLFPVGLIIGGIVVMFDVILFVSILKIIDILF